MPASGSPFALVNWSRRASAWEHRLSPGVRRLALAADVQVFLRRTSQS